MNDSQRGLFTVDVDPVLTVIEIGNFLVIIASGDSRKVVNLNL